MIDYYADLTTSKWEYTKNIDDYIANRKSQTGKVVEKTKQAI